MWKGAADTLKKSAIKTKAKPTSLIVEKLSKFWKENEVVSK